MLKRSHPGYLVALRTLGASLVVSGVGNVAMLAGRLATQIVILRLITPDEYSKYATLIVVFELLAIFIDIAPNQALLSSGYGAKARGLFFNIVSVQAIILAILCYPIAIYMNYEYKIYIILCLGRYLTWISYGLQMELEAVNNQITLALIRISASISTLALIIITIYLYNSSYILLIIRDLFFGFMYALFSSMYLHRLPSFRFELAGIGRSFSILVSNWMIQLTDRGSSRLEYFLVLRTVGAETYGFYHQVRTFLETLSTTLEYPLRTAMFSFFLESDNRRHGSNILLHMILAILGACVLALLLPLQTIGAWILTTLYGSNWAAGGDLFSGFAPYVLVMLGFQGMSAYFRSGGRFGIVALARAFQFMVFLAVIIAVAPDSLRSLGYTSLAAGVGTTICLATIALLVRPHIRSTSIQEASDAHH